MMNTLIARGKLRHRSRALVSAFALPVVFASRVAFAQESSESAPPVEAGPAPSATTSPTTAPNDAGLERRYQELIERQRHLEERLDATAPREDAAVPLAGYSDKNFYLKDRNDWFVLIPKGRINVDYYNFLNRPLNPPSGVATNSAADPRPKDTMFLRRARIGFAGTIAGHIDFRVESELANTRLPGQYADATDASIVFNFTQYVQLEVGQFYTPFTLENPTSENYTDFMEKSAAVRYAVPTSRETGVMLFGESPRKALRYWVGAFNGDGQEYKNLDNRAALIGRAILSPLALLPRHPEWQENIWFGGSYWTQKAQNLGGASAPSTTAATQGDISNVTTQAGLNVFSSNYSNGTDASNNALRTHLAPNGLIQKYALEVNVPLWKRFGLRAEYIHQTIDVTQYNDTAATRTTGGSGTMTGSGGYIEAYGWIGQEVNVDLPGLYQTPHWAGYVQPPPPHMAVMLAAKYEHVGFNVNGLPSTTKGGADPAAGSYSLDVFELGASLWFTRHHRIMANYIFNYIGGADNAAVAEQKNLFFRKADQELVLRFAVSL